MNIWAVSVKIRNVWTSPEYYYEEDEESAIKSFNHDFENSNNFEIRAEKIVVKVTVKD